MTDLHYEISVDGRAQVMRPMSRRALVKAIARTRCAECGRVVSANDRVVVRVFDECRVFHELCSESGPAVLEAAVARRPVTDARHRALQAQVDAAKREVI